MVAIAGQLARSTGIEIRSLGMKANESITIGQGVQGDANGNAEAGTTAGTIARGLFVAVETVDNTGGSANDLYIRVASGNTYVYTTAGGAIKVGEAVKFDASAEVVADTTILAGEVAVGRYIAHENEEATPTDAVDGDIVIVRLGL
jgi:hypothetical protein